MLYNLAIVIYDLLVQFAAPFSRKPRKMMKGHWVVYELLRQQVEKIKNSSLNNGIRFYETDRKSTRLNSSHVT